MSWLRVWSNTSKKNKCWRRLYLISTIKITRWAFFFFVSHFSSILAWLIARIIFSHNWFPCFLLFVLFLTRYVNIIPTVKHFPHYHISHQGTCKTNTIIYTIVFIISIIVCYYQFLMFLCTSFSDSIFLFIFSMQALERVFWI